MTIEVESYRFSEVRWALAPFEGRFMPTFKVELMRERRTYPPGSMVAPLAQESAKVAINLEKLAREMMSKDPELRGEFARRLAADPKFASSPRERLQFFYERSPYWDRQLNLYPVGRVTGPLTIKALDVK